MLKVGDTVQTTVTGVVSQVYDEERCLVTIHGEEVPMLASHLTTKNELEELVLDLLGLAESATSNFGHYNKEWDKHHQELKARAYTITHIGEEEL